MDRSKLFSDIQNPLTDIDDGTLLSLMRISDVDIEYARDVPGPVQVALAKRTREQVIDIGKTEGLSQWARNAIGFRLRQSEK